MDWSKIASFIQPWASIFQSVAVGTAALVGIYYGRRWMNEYLGKERYMAARRILYESQRFFHGVVLLAPAVGGEEFSHELLQPESMAAKLATMMNPSARYLLKAFGARPLSTRRRMTLLWKSEKRFLRVLQDAHYLFPHELFGRRMGYFPQVMQALVSILDELCKQACTPGLDENTPIVIKDPPFQEMVRIKGLMMAGVSEMDEILRVYVFQRSRLISRWETRKLKKILKRSAEQNTAAVGASRSQAIKDDL